MGKPRMTRRDAWKKRPQVLRYHAFRDDIRVCIRNQRINLAGAGWVGWIAYLPMPASWSAKKKATHLNQPHTQRPDRDNIDKAILDALFPEDSGVHSGYLKKLWADEAGPRIVLLVQRGTT